MSYFGIHAYILKVSACLIADKQNGGWVADCVL